MNEKKREKVIKVCRVIALILAAIMVFGIIMQSFI